MEVIFFLLLLCSNANAEIVKQQSNGALSKSASDSAYFNIPTEASAATMTGPLTLSGSSLTVTGIDIPLKVSNGITNSTMVSVENTGNNPTWIRFHSGATTLGSINRSGNDLSINPWPTAGNLILAENGRPVTIPGSSFSVGGSTLVVSGGRVEIGDNTPVMPLNIKGVGGVPKTSASALNTASAGHLLMRGADANAWYFGTYASTPYGVWAQGVNEADTSVTHPMVLQPSGGNVGIAITDPSEKLEVAGGIAHYSRSMAELLAIIPSQVGVSYFCNNCTPAKMVVSTGTSAGNFASIDGGTFQ